MPAVGASESLNPGGVVDSPRVQGGSAARGDVQFAESRVVFLWVCM